MTEKELTQKMYSGLTDMLLNIGNENPEMTTIATINAVSNLLGALLLTAPTKEDSLEALEVATKCIKEYIDETWPIAEAEKGCEN